MIIERESPQEGPPQREIDENRSPFLPEVRGSVNPITENPKQEAVHNGFIGGPQKRAGFKLVLWMWTAAAIDYLLILAGSLIALILFSVMVTSLSKSGELASSYATLFFKSILHPKKVNLTWLLMLISVGWTYFVVTRSFMGASIGERFCDLRVGKPSERMHAFYSVRLIGRISLVLVTGVFIIPILSLLFRRDLAGKFSGGLYIYSLK